ncbi:hypothetical protein OHA53_30745 [Streptomyces althioticus]|uniref:hypothetical protein n=1 Tax=Streptomyces althioticus TaxID=83380 RepID=UPI0038731513|nr:hypothetical protein OHA53_30745 [Streptomyces althioticus]
MKNTASWSRTNSDAPTASTRTPSCSVRVAFRTSHTSSRTRIWAPGGKRASSPLVAGVVLKSAVTQGLQGFGS